MTAGLELMKNVLAPLAKSVLELLGISAGMSAADVAIPKKIYGSETTALIVSNEEIENITKIDKSLETYFDSFRVACPIRNKNKL